MCSLPLRSRSLSLHPSQDPYGRQMGHVGSRLVSPIPSVSLKGLETYYPGVLVSLYTSSTLVLPKILQDWAHLVPN